MSLTAMHFCNQGKQTLLDMPTDLLVLSMYTTQLSVAFPHSCSLRTDTIAFQFSHLDFTFLSKLSLNIHGVRCICDVHCIYGVHCVGDVHYIHIVPCICDIYCICGVHCVCGVRCIYDVHCICLILRI